MLHKIHRLETTLVYYLTVCAGQGSGHHLAGSSVRASPAAGEVLAGLHAHLGTGSITPQRPAPGLGATVVSVLRPHVWVPAAPPPGLCPGEPTLLRAELGFPLVTQILGRQADSPDFIPMVGLDGAFAQLLQVGFSLVFSPIPHENKVTIL